MRENNVFAISYPKSGRTWLKLLVAAYLSQFIKQGTRYIENLEKLCRLAHVPRLIFNHSGSSLNRMYINSFNNEDQIKRFKSVSVIFLTRNLEDIIVSSYYQAKFRHKQYNGSFHEFLRDDMFGVKRVIRFYQMWDVLRLDCSRFHMISYEALHENTALTLSEVLIFLGIKEPHQGAIDNAVVFCQFDNLQTLEKKRQFKNHSFRAMDTENIASYKFRKGAVGGSLEEYSDEDLEYVKNCIKDNPLALIKSALI